MPDVTFCGRVAGQCSQVVFFQYILFLYNFYILIAFLLLGGIKKMKLQETYCSSFFCRGVFHGWGDVLMKWKKFATMEILYRPS